MRTIKFRAWDKERGMMVVVTEWRIGGSIVVQSTPDAPDYILNPADYELMQFTGLLDKNGKEIYEGDVVDISGNKIKKNMPEIIGWDEEASRFCFVYETGEPMRDFNKTDKSKWEIIGNIYENPDLLTQPKQDE